ncbi:hypothetical protein [Sphingobacterium sp. LRF_L2]|uniref:hypothetical protein n=1 Tax=Sphingobacterium sp. LRF_L2 TaxID=3369421 RepID=UPI003F606C55
MARFFTFVLLLQLSLTPFFLKAETPEEKWQDCEQITKIALEKLTPIVEKNNYENLESVLNTIQSTCGENEFTQRLRILRTLIEKKTSGALIADYLAKNYQEILVMRWDYSAEKEYKRIYQNNKADFNFIPLNHPIDSLVKLKAEALLNSTSFVLTEQEREIALLFADHLDEFYQTFEETPAQQPATSPKERQHHGYKDRTGFSLYAGAEFPITGSDPLFKTNPTFGFYVSSKLSSLFLFEVGAKVRVNSNDRSFDYLLYDEVEHVNSSISFSLGGNIGAKAFDNDKFLIYPKVGLYWESTSTGLSEVTSYYDDGYYYDDYNNGSTSTVKYHNVNTMRTTLGISVMRHLAKKNYIGLEAAYHYIPYNWDDNLITSIQPNYASLQLFFRF